MAIRITSSNYGGRVSISSRGLGGRFQYGADPVPLLLDIYSNATAAYSVRKLRNGYGGSAIRVRRSSDNAETDIGFTSIALDTSTLLTFCGTGSGFVTKWYDQSGNSRDAIQPTTANQPRIVSSGSITYLNSKPVIENISSAFLYTTQTAFNTLQTHSDFIVTKGVTQSQPSNYVGYLVFGPSSGNDYQNTTAITINSGDISTGKNLDINASAYSIIGSGLVTQHRLISHIINAQSGQAWSNRLPIGSANGSFATTNGGSLYIGARYIAGVVNTSYSYLGYFQEIITYNSSQLTNRTSIESNINAYYSMYVDSGTWTGTGTALLDLYPSASAAYSLRNVSSTYTGSLIRVRRSSDNTELDITGTLAGNIDTNLLLDFVGSGNAFVSKWYDQSGNARHMLQTGTAQQPTIVSAGSLILQNGKPCVKFTATSTNTMVTSGGGYTTTAMSAFSAFSYTSNSQQYTRILSHLPASGGDAASGYIPIIRDSNFNKFGSYSINTDANPFIASVAMNQSTCTLFSNIATGTTVTNYVNSTTSASVNFNLNITRSSMVMGSSTGDGYYDGNMSELVMYLSNQTTNRTAIESNINSYYTIY